MSKVIYLGNIWTCFLLNNSMDKCCVLYKDTACVKKLSDICVCLNQPNILTER